MRCDCFESYVCLPCRGVFLPEKTSMTHPLPETDAVAALRELVAVTEAIRTWRFSDQNSLEQHADLSRRYPIALDEARRVLEGKALPVQEATAADIADLWDRHFSGDEWPPLMHKRFSFARELIALATSPQPAERTVPPESVEPLREALAMLDTRACRYCKDLPVFHKGSADWTDLELAAGYRFRIIDGEDTQVFHCYAGFIEH